MAGSSPEVDCDCWDIDPFCRCASRLAATPCSRHAESMSKVEGTGTSFAQRERLALADLFDELGPEAPTLCEGWTTRDLVSHLVLREGHLAAAGIAIRPLRAWTTRIHRNLAEEPFGHVVTRFRDGPPTFSPMRLPGIQASLSTFEHFVHHEDVRRAASTWSARELAVPDQLTLWQQLTSRARLLVRGAPIPVRLVGEGHGVVSVGETGLPTTLSVRGEPGELVIYLHGRRNHAEIQVTGPEASLASWDRHVLKV